MIRVLSVFGTRPEAVKMAPVVLALQKQPARICARICVTGQHREMLDQVLALFEITPHVDLNLMQPNQTLSELTARILTQMDQVLAAEAPDVVLVQGDTTTVMAASLAAFYRKIPVGHVEAGLRSGDIYSPYPEEINRRMAGVIAQFHFAPTETSRQALLRENIPDSSIYVTGNTVIDALHATVCKPAPAAAQALLAAAGRAGGNKVILVTAHRRENFGAPLESICLGLKSLVERNPDVAIIYPVHLNPNVQEPVRRILGAVDRIVLAEPVTYDVMAHLMNAAHLVLTDSGGLQEEAPTLGKPVLVMRTDTERPEAVASGTAKLVGADAKRIVAESERLLYDQAAYEQMARAISPYGDGRAAERIVQILLEKLSGQ